MEELLKTIACELVENKDAVSVSAKEIKEAIEK